MSKPFHLAVLASLVVCAPVAHADEPDEAPASLEDRLAAGEVVVTPHRVEGYSIPALSVECVIDVPAEKVWALVDDCYGYRKTMPRVAESVETERAGANSICKWRVSMPFPFSDINTVVAAKSVASPTRWQRDFHQVSGDFVRNEGYWRLERFGPDGKRTRVNYRLHAVMASVVPDGFVKRGQVKAMHEMIGIMRAALK
jgi:ribosome-associated toxin RatA of RatAB toxin-antitoxin module